MQAKLTTPHTVDAVASPVLLRRFESCAQLRLTVVSAPAGYGKTTVTVAALRAMRLPHVWYRVDVLDHDPAVTVLSLCEALRRLRSNFGGLLRERLLHPHESPLSAEGMAAAFVVEVQDEAPKELHLVIDDYHEASASGEFNRMLDYLIDNLPESWRLIVLGRYEPGFETAKLRVAGQLGFIGAGDLRLDETQVHELLLRHVPEASRDHAARLAELTEGWPAAVSLAAESLSGHDVVALDEVLSDPRLTSDVYAYLAEQVYRQERDDVRDFLKHTCYLDSVTPEIAGRLAGANDAHRHLEHLARNHVFTFKAPETGSYRFHQLFRDYLRETCLREDGPVECRQRQLHTATVLEEGGEIERSVELLIAADRPELALDVISRQGEAAFGRHRAETLDAWLVRLPVALIESHPWAQLLSAHRETRDGRYEQALHHIDAAADSFRRAGDRHGVYSALSAKERALFWKGEPQAAVDACRQALDVAESDDERLHTIASMLSSAIDMGDWPAVEAAQRAGAKLSAKGPPEELLRIRTLRSHALYLRGQLREAYAESQRIDIDAVPPYFQPVALGARATIAYALACYPEAGRLGSTALTASRQMGHEMVVGFCLDTLGFLRVLRDGDGAGLGDIEVARATFLKLGDIAAAAWPTMHIGTYHRRHGHIDLAASAYRDAVGMTAGERDILAAANARVNLEFTAGLQGSRTALDRLLELEEQAASTSLAFARNKAAFFRGSLHLRKGQAELGLPPLKAAVAAQVELGHLSFLGRELLTQRDVAEILLAELADESVVSAVIDAIARHRDSLDAVVVAASLGEVHALAALEAAERWFEEAERVSLARAVLTMGFRRARERAAAKLMPTSTSPEDRVRLTYDLTAREAQVLGLIARGLTNQEIEAMLHLSHATVKTHVNHIFRKLGVTDRVTALLRHAEAAAPSD